MNVETRLTKLEAMAGLGCDRWMVRQAGDDEYLVYPVGHSIDDAQPMTRAEVEALPGVQVVLPAKARSAEEWSEGLAREAAV